MSNTTIADGGVLPNINPLLLPSKSKKGEKEGAASRCLSINNTLKFKQFFKLLINILVLKII